MNTDNKFQKALIIIGIIAFFSLIDYWCLKLSKILENKFENFNITFKNKTENFGFDFENITDIKKEINLINFMDVNSNSSTIIENKNLTDTIINENITKKFDTNETIQAIIENSQKEKNRLNINTNVEKESSKDKKDPSTEIIIVSPTNTIHFPFGNVTKKDLFIEENNKTLNKEIVISNETNIPFENEIKNITKSLLEHEHVKEKKEKHGNQTQIHEKTHIIEGNLIF